MKWLRKLLGLCQHHWVEYDRARLTYNTEYGKGFYGHTIYTMQCKHCGKLYSHKDRP